MSWVNDLIGGGLEGIMKGGAEIVSKFVPDPNKAQEALIELQKLELQGRSMVFEAEKARLNDVQTARELYGKDSIIQKILALLFTVSFFGLTIFIMFLLKAADLSETQNNLIFTIFGAVNAIMVTIVSFFFGSSKGSGDKDMLIADALKTATKKP